jgi:tRNA pseudouridine32 synthase/23S rRNA pseudouridine746 synthase
MHLLHRFTQDITDVEPLVRFNNPFYYSPHRLCAIAAGEVRANMLGSEAVAAEAAKGKMFGVLVVRDKEGCIGYLAAFSGLFMGTNNVEGFVPPVFDLQRPDGYFKTEESRITAINTEICNLENSVEYAAAKKVLATERGAADEAVAALRAEFARNKAERASKRLSGGLSAADEAALIKESQFEKAELKRVQRTWQAKVQEKELLLKSFTDRLAQLAAERKRRSAALQRWLFEQFVMLDARGEGRTLIDIFKEQRGCIPPAGAGECAGPKLLQYAYQNNLSPLAMAEFWVGESPAGEVRRDGCFYGACKSKCEPILTYMLQGLDVEENALERGEDVKALEVVYEDEWLVAVNKPSGVLSVPGIVGGTSVQQWLREEYLHCNELFVVHRLDMATSGVLLAAKSMEVYKEMQRQFASREVRKEYMALLDGVPSADEGVIELPLSADYENRPRQKVDHDGGKEAVTRYRVLDTLERDGRQCALVRFEPLTGRTHQLRVHAAHKCGLDTPIVGDGLYGNVATRLMLHAASLEFVHPLSGVRTKIDAKVSF